MCRAYKGSDKERRWGESECAFMCTCGERCPTGEERTEPVTFSFAVRKSCGTNTYTGSLRSSPDMNCSASLAPATCSVWLFQHVISLTPCHDMYCHAGSTRCRPVSITERGMASAAALDVMLGTSAMKVLATREGAMCDSEVRSSSSYPKSSSFTVLYTPAVLMAGAPVREAHAKCQCFLPVVQPCARPGCKLLVLPCWELS
jgi:hypothetical protein